MHRRTYLILVSSFLMLTGCNRTAVPTLDREIEIAVRAGLGQLSESEKECLLKEDHSILLLLAEPSARRVLEHFARLPMEQHVTLRDKGFLKWRFADLDAASQDEFLGLLLLRFAAMRGGEVSEEARRETSAVLRQSDIGFVDVELLSNSRHVISFFVFWPDSEPSTLAFINADGVDPAELSAAHNRRLTMLRMLGYSKVPVRTNLAGQKSQRREAANLF